MKRILTAIALISVACAQVAMAQNKSEVESFLREFRADSAKAMSKLPPKRNQDGNEVKGSPYFSSEDIKQRRFVAIKDEERQKTCKVVAGKMYCLGDEENYRSGYIAGDRPEDLLGSPVFIDTLEGMEQDNIRQAELAQSPWSDDYWPIYMGQLGIRYADEKFPYSSDWKENLTYVTSNPVAAVLSSGNQSAIDNLSPSEKFDLLIGDQNSNLTTVNWRVGQSYYERYGKVETWMGLCHGWAPASFSMERPKKAIQLLAADGRTKITFFPSDIKALATLLWANARVQTNFMGGRCDDKNPERDENGRIRSQACFDNNPAAWHVAVVNRIGKDRTSFVLDATYDYEVWNQPAFGYKYTYFNPVTDQAVETIAEAKVANADFVNDKFKKYRDPRATHIVGVAMDVSYMVENLPNHNTEDGPQSDNKYTVTYIYDLELDANGKIIGGEWYMNSHPDFLWAPAKGMLPWTVGDSQAQGEWKNGEVMPLSWQKGAEASARRGVPLYKIVSKLIELAQ